VAAVTGSAAYLATGDAQVPALCLAAPAAVRVPCAMVLGAGAAAAPAGLRVGQAGTAGGGELRLGTLTVRVARWWRPSRPSLAGTGLRPLAGVLPTVAGLLGWGAGPGSYGDGAGVLPAVAGLLGWGAGLGSCGDGAGVSPGVAGLLGWGAGLTPYGDDVLAGALVALAAVGSPRAGTLAGQVLPAAFGRTTFVSAALLVHAARGECVPELAAVLHALPAGAPAELARAVGALLAVGHSSGAGLLVGMIVGLLAGVTGAAAPAPVLIRAVGSGGGGGAGGGTGRAAG
jgi:hypothetical protein